MGGGVGWGGVGRGCLAYTGSEQLPGLAIRYPLHRLGKSSLLGVVAYGKPPEMGKEGGGI